MANPQIVYINTYSGTGASGQSAYVTFSFSIANGYEAFIPIKVITPASVSAGAEVWVYRTMDAGASYETVGTIYQAFPATGGSTMIRALDLTTGIYLIAVLGGGGVASTFSYQFAATAFVISAYA